ncbi:MAG: HAD-IA family hydrolase [Planctomycetes bacterium]|nr:HAD-IA family hydrolase [Planctomycetota bacterium]
MTDAPIAVPHAALFDLDGTLSDSLPDIHWALDAARRELGLPGVSIDAVQTWVGCGASMLVARSLGHEDEHSPDVRRVLDVFLRHYEAHSDERSTVYPGVVAALEALRVRGVKLAVTTNKPGRAADSLLRGLGLLPWFDLVVTPDSAGVRKPAAAFMRFALDHLHVAAADALVIGDGMPDVEAAKGAGVPVVALLDGYGNRAALLAAGANYYAADVAEVARRMGIVA